ncbi:hypothetical protein Z042_21285 [Chania multitudinisentens RB-25]|uniref:EpsG family protein n=1 Tax=Chania multitudinisentens RB-25 TaxID=1441930 RepID=W0LGI4_9GAMM|nr:EpsG family protein [Chania multitudinisentens]AHG22953.1 hypothetical protein Z042_21285 [Chania multitudinisentens RB-25]
MQPKPYTMSQPAIQQSLNQICWTGLYIVFTILIVSVYLSVDNIGIAADKPAYELLFSYLSYDMGIPAGFERVEPVFLAFTWLIAKLTNSANFYFCLIFTLIFLGLTCRTGKHSPLFRDRFYLIVLWLSFPFFYSLSINVLRQGLALVFVIYALDAEISLRKYKSLALLALGAMFHFSIAIYMPIFLLLRCRIGLRLLLVFWAFCVICAILSIPQTLITIAATLPSVSLQEKFPYYFSYLTGRLTDTYDMSFKFRFLAFSALPIIALFTFKSFKLQISNDCIFLLKVYLTLNGFFFLVGYIPFSDRIALLSWQLMPLLAVGLTPVSVRPAAMFLAALSACIMFAYFLIF